MNIKSDLVLLPMGSKMCSKCRKTLPPSAFYPSKTSKDGLTHDCRECRKQWRRRYSQTDHAKRLQAARRQLPKNKVKRSSRYRVRTAVNNGRLPHISTQSCYCCGVQATHYHHYLGYECEHWLDVIPMCWRHGELDGKRPKGVLPDMQMALPI